MHRFQVKHLNRVKRIAKQAGLGSLRIHDLRHSFASISLHRGVPITTLAVILGSDAATLFDTYAHALPAGEDTAARALQQALAGASWER